MLELQVVLGRERGRVIPLRSGTWTIGRASASDVPLAGEIVSRAHASLVFAGSRVTVTDLGSSNGTFVNGSRVLGEAVVAPSDVLLIGDVALRLCAQAARPLSPGSALEPFGKITRVRVEGTLLEVPPTTVLRYVAVLKRTTTLVLTSPPLEGRVSFVRGHVAAVRVGGRGTRDPVQALTAIMRWRGTFTTESPEGVASGALLGLDTLLPPVGSEARAARSP